MGSMTAIPSKKTFRRSVQPPGSELNRGMRDGSLNLTVKFLIFTAKK
jgi:hypothetical protein